MNTTNTIDEKREDADIQKTNVYLFPKQIIAEGQSVKSNEHL